MKTVYNRFIPFGRKFYAINLFGILFAKGPCGVVTINHEKIHTRQIRECGYIFFYIFYVAEWLVRLLSLRNSYRAYRNISFEREAYAHENDLNYLKKRKRFAFAAYPSASDKSSIRRHP